MAKVNEEARKKYFEHVAPYTRKITELNNKEKRILGLIRGQGTGESYKRLSVTADILSEVAYYLVMNTLSVSLLGVKNENALNDARKACYRAIIQLEKVFTDFVDVPYSDYEPYLNDTISFPEVQRYALIRKCGLSITMVKDGFGENSRWKWSIVELEARLAAVAKNILNLKTLLQGMDPRTEGYRERIAYFNLVRRLLQTSADAYRLKYEVSTKRMDDFRVAISYLGALQRLSLMLGRQAEAVALKRKMDVWKEKMEMDNKNDEKTSRIQRLEGKSSDGES